MSNNSWRCSSPHHALHPEEAADAVPARDRRDHGARCCWGRGSSRRGQRMRISPRGLERLTSSPPSWSSGAVRSSGARQVAAHPAAIGLGVHGSAVHVVAVVVGAVAMSY